MAILVFLYYFCSVLYFNTSTLKLKINTIYTFTEDNSGIHKA